MRHEFDKNKNIQDLRVAKALLLKGEDDLFNEVCLDYIKIPNAPGGVAYNRDIAPPDWLLDYWHPMEKSMYPKYFALREQRKKEYEEFHRKEYGEYVPEKPEH
jgi:NADH dehydrogenase (ubiquinone) 1 beta subcomplex subunit 9